MAASPREEPKTVPERSDAAIEPESSIQLMNRARSGDDAALNELCARYLPRLRRWASGRLPSWARDLRETDDLVVETIAGVIHRLDRFEFRHDGAFQAYLRQALLNRLREEIRRSRRRPAHSPEKVEPADTAPSPIEEVIGRQALEIYEAALNRLHPEEREMVLARVELHQSYAEIARAMLKPSADAARMAVSRALVRLSKEMGRVSRG